MQGTQEGAGWLSLSRREWKPWVVKKGLGKETPTGASMHSQRKAILQRQTSTGGHSGRWTPKPIRRERAGHPQKEQGEEGGGRCESRLIWEENKQKEVHIAGTGQREPCYGGRGMERGRPGVGGEQWMTLRPLKLCQG